MSHLLFDVERVGTVLMWASAAVALSVTLVLVAARVLFAWREQWHRRVDEYYQPVVRRALGGDAAALAVLGAAPRRHRIPVARLLVEPLIGDRDPDRIVRTRAAVRALNLFPIVDRYLQSRMSSRRAVALRALGLLRMPDCTPSIVAALDDTNREVRAAALDALADLGDPASLPAIVVRLNDASLDRVRRVAALGAFGAESEPLLLELSSIDPEHCVNYARALAICGTERSRPVLSAWTRDARAGVRAAAFEALAHTGLDDDAARLAIGALDDPEAQVRATAAEALRGWAGAGDAASHLARHLDDVWPVAVRAARTLRSLGTSGRVELEAGASRPDLAGRLARQMLWEDAARC